MDKTFSEADSFEEADAKDFAYYAALSSEERLNIALALMKPVYDAYPRFERVYRVVEFGQGPVLDSWRLGGEQLPDPESDR